MELRQSNISVKLAFFFFFSYFNPWSTNITWKICAAVLWPFSRLSFELCGSLKTPQSEYVLSHSCEINNDRSWECISNSHVPAGVNPPPSLIEEFSAKVPLELCKKLYGREKINPSTFICPGFLTLKQILPIY